MHLSSGIVSVEKDTCGAGLFHASMGQSIVLKQPVHTMKTKFIGAAILLTATFSSSAQSERYVSVTAAPNMTNQVTINDTETAQLLYFLPASGSTPNMYYQKDGLIFNALAIPYFTSGGPTVKGPAIFTLVSQGAPSVMTLKIMPESFDPNKTLILPPGTNQVNVAMETSTNLVNWVTATNGIYGSPETARFFRIRMEKLN
jgi:hypothetical protein